MNVLCESLNKYFDNLEEKYLIEKYLAEAKWYKYNANGNDYYAYVKDPSDYQQLFNDEKDWNKSKHNPLNNTVLQKFRADVNASGDFNIVNAIQSKPPKHKARVITAGDSAFRGKNAEKKADISTEMQEDIKKIPHDKLLIHHINKQEYDTNRENLAIVPYKENERFIADLAHKIFHVLPRKDVRDGTGQIDIDYVTVTGTHTIQIRII